jgi:hypothetical protein
LGYRRICAAVFQGERYRLDLDRRRGVTAQLADGAQSGLQKLDYSKRMFHWSSQVGATTLEATLADRVLEVSWVGAATRTVLVVAG